jgi:putative ABC transport system ATP-binding protein
MIAVVGDGASGKEHLPYMLAGLMAPATGHVSIGGEDVAKLPEPVLGRRVGFVSQQAYLFAQSVRENLLYGLKHYPMDEVDRSPEAVKERERRVAEAKKAANSTLDSDADWIDYAAAGAASPAELNAHLVDCVRVVGLEEDIYRFGLFGKVDPKARPEIAEAVLKARKAMGDRLGTDGESDLVEHFHADRYTMNATLGENLLYGTPTKAAYGSDQLAKNALIREILKELELERPLAERGLKIAQFFVEIFADLPSGHPFFEQFSFISSDDLPLYDQLVQRVEKVGVEGLGEDEYVALMGLPFNYVEARHRLDLVDEDFAQRIAEARETVMRRIEEEDPGAVAFYNAEEYNAAASLLDNILFGRLVYGQAEAQETVEAMVAEVLEEMDLRDEVLEVGLDYDVGGRGQRLTATQRQKLGIARALVKRPDLMVLEEATGVMDGATRAKTVDAVLADRRAGAKESEGRGGVFWTLERASLAERFDYVLVMKHGRLVEEGSYADLDKEGSALRDLLSSD